MTLAEIEQRLAAIDTIKSQLIVDSIYWVYYGIVAVKFNCPPQVAAYYWKLAAVSAATGVGIALKLKEINEYIAQNSTTAETENPEPV